VGYETHSTGCVGRIMMGSKVSRIPGWLLLVVCASVGVYRAQGQNCTQNDCVEINYWGSGPVGMRPSCAGVCNDAFCVVVTHDCTSCSPAGNKGWCLNQDASKICCPDGTNIYVGDCVAGTCTLQCPNKPSTVLQQATCTAFDKNTINTVGHEVCITKPSSGKCP
jgi:hypothetical protein